MPQLRKRISRASERIALAARFFTPGKAPPANLRRVVFVCTGNICRSPYAEFIARRHGIEAISAGIDTQNGLPADATALTEANRRGVDMSAHRTTRWQDVELREGDLIVTLQLRHALATRQRASAHHCPVVMLSAFLRPAFTVLHDPYGKPQPVFAEVFDCIDVAVSRLADWGLRRK
jgi:protein-tyrosine phosphatase